jgi:hypothetical protein
MSVVHGKATGTTIQESRERAKDSRRKSEEGNFSNITLFPF